ncbi:MAG: ketopantoate reductase family protein [Candidatus Xenobia bacterium]
MKAARILVFGAGAIGQWIGCRMALAGHEVTLLVRPAQRDAIQKRGVLLKETGRQHMVRNLRAASDIRELGAFDWVFLTTKAYDVARALEDLAPVLAGQAQLVMFQNGIGTEALGAQAVGPKRAWICSVTKALSHPEPGVVEETNRSSGVGLAPYLDDAPVEAIRDLFEPTGIPRVVSPHHHDVKWSKLLLNMLGNATCAILDMPTAAVFGHPGVFRLEQRAFKEAVDVMERKHIGFLKLPGYPVPMLKTAMTTVPLALLQPLMKKRMAEGRGRKDPSLRLDMQKSPPRSEVRYLNGAIVRFGETVGLRTPANDFITRTLEGIVSGEIPWDRYRKRPDDLVKDFRAFHLTAKAEGKKT